jgi:asparagine synthase (glutamine-hydrolysing)
MTAICGLWNRDGRDAAEDCARMRRALKIYGPHRDGQWGDGPVCFGIQHFHTVPEDRFDRQPLVGGGGRFMLVCDVRLDNRPELVAELGWSTERVREAADADYVLAAWEKWQGACPDKLIGDWALAVWDAQERTITLARDAMGQRPLFYHAGDGRFAFASMAKGLHALDGIPIAPDLDTVRDYLATAPMRGPGSFFAQISRVEPGGEVVLYADGRIATRRWHDWSRIAEREVSDDSACIEEFRAIFDRAVADSLRSIGAVASHLSGGFDSTAVVVTAAEMLAAKGERLAAFTHVPHQGWQTENANGRSIDEGPIAAATAARFPNIDHVLVDSGERQIGADLDASFYYGEFPVLNICNQVWSNEINRLARATGATVMLSAGAGNMTISRVGQERLHELAASGHVFTWLREAVLLRRNRQMGVGGILFQTFGPWMPPRLMKLLHRISGKPVGALSRFSALNPKLAESEEFRRHLCDLQFDPAFAPWRSLRQITEFGLTRLDIVCLFNKGDLAAYGIDHRCPVFDRRLVEFSLSLPSRMWLRDGQMKWLYRRVFQGRVPDAVMHQRKKGYQGADWPERLRRSASSIAASAETCRDDPAVESLLDMPLLNAFAKNIPSADLAAKESLWPYRIKLLRGLSVAHFLRKASHRN